MVTDFEYLIFEMKHIGYILILAVLLFSVTETKAEETEEPFNPQKVIFEHLGDEYGWKIGNFSIPLPVIVRSESGEWHLFSSSRLENGTVYEGFRIADGGDHDGRVVEVKENGQEVRPWDLSVTKNVLALIICGLVMMAVLFPLVCWYKKDKYRAPRGVKGMIEVVVLMLYNDLIVPILGKEARRFAPYLLTLFFFILFANLLGLIVIFPGGANLMGNISITLVLAVCTFVVVNVAGTKKYWKDIFWPEVPTWLKCPVPMMPVIELFGIFTKPMALMVRLFANMMGGHLVMIVLISLIFMFGAMGAAVIGTTTVVAVIFAVFMGLIDLLICFIQAYVFMMLSTIFISLSLDGKEEKCKEEKL